MDQFYRFAFGEAACVWGVVAESDDLDGVRTFVDEHAQHFANGLDVDLLITPLLTLHQRGLAVFAQLEVDAAVGAAEAGFFDCVALTTEGFAGQLFELTPVHLAETVDAGLLVEQFSSAFAALEREAGGDPAADQQNPAERRIDAGSGQLAKAGQIRVVERSEVPADAVAYGEVSEQSEGDAHRPRHGRHDVNSTLLPLAHIALPEIPWLGENSLESVRKEHSSGWLGATSPRCALRDVLV
jgi:hypothetical protein